jgi:hypothetical protein
MDVSSRRQLTTSGFGVGVAQVLDGRVSMFQALRDTGRRAASAELGEALVDGLTLAEVGCGAHQVSTSGWLIGPGLGRSLPTGWGCPGCPRSRRQPARDRETASPGSLRRRPARSNASEPPDCPWPTSPRGVGLARCGLGLQQILHRCREGVGILQVGVVKRDVRRVCQSSRSGHQRGAAMAHCWSPGTGAEWGGAAVPPGVDFDSEASVTALAGFRGRLAEKPTT